MKHGSKIGWRESIVLTVVMPVAILLAVIMGAIDYTFDWLARKMKR
jgi:hypothetical protein